MDSQNISYTSFCAATVIGMEFFSKHDCCTSYFFTLIYFGQVPDIIDNAYVIVEFDNGSRGMLDLCMFAEGSKNEQEISVVGDIGKVKLSPYQPFIVLIIFILQFLVVSGNLLIKIELRLFNYASVQYFNDRN